MSRNYDVIIIGSGPAGLSAALYASRAKLNVLVLEKSKNGGQAAITHMIENYPGAIEDPTGPRLTARMAEQAKNFGTEFKQEEVLDVNLEGDKKVVTCTSGDYIAKAVVIATGASPRKLDIPGVRELESKGISYCATCDGDFFDGLEVFVVGGGNSAVEEALFLTKFARKVTIIHFEEDIHCERITAEKARNHPQIEIRTETVVLEAIGDGILEAIKLKNVSTGEEYVVEADEEDGTMGLFFFIGYVPQTKLFEGKVELTEGGYVKAGEDTKTSVEGVYVVGGANSAVEEALFLTKFARKVTIVYRRENVRCEKVTAEKAKNNPKIEILGNTVVTEAIGDGILEAIKLKNLVTGEEYVIEADEEDGTMGLFFFIGYIPQTKLFEGKVEMTEDGYIKAGEDTRTSVPGVYVAGDCRVKDIRQVVTAVSDGAVAAIRAEKYIAEKFE